MRRKAIWITWENQRRNRELSGAFGIKLFELAEIDDIRNLFKKYIFGIIKTLLILVKERPKLVFCQNPSLILSLFLVLLKHLVKIKLCVDAHNAGLFPNECRSISLGLVSRLIQRNADLTIVTNEALKRHVERNGGSAFVLPDRIPDIPVIRPRKLKGKHNILFICSYADDEPYGIVFDAAKNINPCIYIHVTGNYNKRGIQPSDLPDNVILTGYLSEEKYIKMLNSVDATIDLTTRENCLVCGAYESVAVQKPMILSNTRALREYFNMGAVYTENTVCGMVNAILKIIEKREMLIEEVKELRSLREQEWEIRKKELEQVIAQWK